MFVMEGADNVCCKSDQWRLFSLVLTSLDNMSTLTFADMGMCWMQTCSKADWMTFQTR